MFKRLSIVTLTLSGLLLAGCANQQSADLKTSSDKTEQTTSNTPKKSTKSNQTTKSTKSTDETASSEKEDPSKESDSDQTQQDQTTSQTTTDQTQDQSDNQQDQTQQSVNLTTSQEAVEFLADKLSTTYDKSTTQYVANGKVTWNDVNGYQINIYSKNSDSPVGSYLVPANGQYFQIW